MNLEEKIKKELERISESVENLPNDRRKEMGMHLSAKQVIDYILDDFEDYETKLAWSLNTYFGATNEAYEPKFVKKSYVANLFEKNKKLAHEILDKEIDTIRNDISSYEGKYKDVINKSLRLFDRTYSEKPISAFNQLKTIYKLTSGNSYEPKNITKKDILSLNYKKEAISPKVYEF